MYITPQRSNSANRQIIVVEDDPVISSICTNVAHRSGYSPQVFETKTEFFARDPKILSGLLVLDLLPRETDVFNVLRHIGLGEQDVVVVLSMALDASILRSLHVFAKLLDFIIVDVIRKPRINKVLTRLLVDYQRSKQPLEVNEDSVYEFPTHRPEARPQFEQYSQEELRVALETGSITPWYQPIVDLRSADVTSIEALARWQHPRLGVVSAMDFLDQIDSSELMEQLTYKILSCSLSTQRNLLDIDLEVACCVNVQATLLSNPSFISWVETLLSEHELSADNLTIEVTDSGTVGDVHALNRSMSHLRVMGVGVAVDDVKVRELDQLMLPVTRIKVDSLKVWLAMQDAAALAELKRIAATCDELGFESVAEGIETVEMLEMAKEAGFSHAQGYLWSAAVPAAKIAKTITSIQPNVHSKRQTIATSR